MKYYIQKEGNGTYFIRQTDNGVMTSWATIKPHEQAVYLVHIETLKQFRGKGYGRKLLDYIRTNSKIQIVGNWRNVESRDFFVRSGAKLSGRSFVR